jgi:hypothetical protein
VRWTERKVARTRIGVHTCFIRRDPWCYVWRVTWRLANMRGEAGSTYAPSVVKLMSTPPQSLLHGYVDLPGIDRGDYEL